MSDRMANRNAADLGAAARAAAQKPKAATGMQAMVRRLDEDGTYEPQLVRGPSGEVVAVPHRSDVVDAEQLVEMLMIGVRRELRAFAVRLGRPEAGPTEESPAEGS